MTAKQLAIVILVLAVIRLVFYVNPAIAQKNLKLRRVIVEYLDSIVIAGVVALFIIQFLFRTFYIPSGSMIPTLQVKDYILVNEYIYRMREPGRGDIVVFKPPPSANADGKDYIKRIVGVGGDTLSVKDGRVILNEKPLDEPFVVNKPDYEMETIKIPDGHYFVMGDNRSSSADSHIWGFLPRENIIGKAILIILPPARISRFE